MNKKEEKVLQEIISLSIEERERIADQYIQQGNDLIGIGCLIKHENEKKLHAQERLNTHARSRF